MFHLRKSLHKGNCEISAFLAVGVPHQTHPFFCARRHEREKNEQNCDAITSSFCVIMLSNSVAVPCENQFLGRNCTWLNNAHLTDIDVSHFQYYVSIRVVQMIRSWSDKLLMMAPRKVMDMAALDIGRSENVDALCHCSSKYHVADESNQHAVSSSNLALVSQILY